MPGKFELYTDKAGDYRFRLKAGNGETVLVSEGYKSRRSAKNGIQSVQKNARDVALFEPIETAKGNFRFNLRAKNKQIIGTSENYASSAARDGGMQAVGAAAVGAAVADLTA
jgi:uncharacterized protein